MSLSQKQKINFLFVDDSESDNDYIKLLVEIEDLQIDMTFRGNGLEAMNYLKEVKQEDFPAIIMVDINMPLVDGFEFLELYEEAFHKKNKETKLFMMSSTRRLSEIEKARNHVVIEDFFEKPLEKKHFENQIIPVLKNA